MLTSAQTQQYQDQGYLTLPGFFRTAELDPVDAYLRANAGVTWTDQNDDPLRIHGSEPNQTNTRRAALTIRYVPATTRIQDQPDRRQFLVRGRAVANGNVYYRFDP